MAEEKPKSRVKCQGRFAELREFLYEEVFPVLMEGRTLVSGEDLQNIWLIALEDIYNRAADRVDSYYESKTDLLRKKPNKDPLSIVPLIESPHFTLMPGLISQYCTSMGVVPDVASKLETVCSQQPNLLAVLGREPSNIFFPSGENLKGYILSGNFGVGTLVPGGYRGSGVISDAPFSIGISKLDTNPDRRGEFNLAAVMGFWVQNDEMVVSQIQACRNAELPKKTPLGIGLLHVAECLASTVGLRKVSTYSARAHPIFKQHPDNWARLGPEFVCLYDTSTHKLGFDGGRTGYHTKELVHPSCK